MIKRTIPQIRQRLHELAVELRCPELADLAEETRRRYHGRKAPAEANSVTPKMARRVRAFAARNPRKTQRSIGQRFGIDHGRVSEILFGKRGEA